MKIRIIIIGKIKSGPHKLIADDYIKRIKHYAPFEILSVKDENDLIKKLGSDNFLIVCEERGKDMISKKFASFIEERQIRSTKYLTFVIGPAQGFTKTIKDMGNLQLSLSKFTIQHDLALIILLEQIYRAYTIIKGESYHK